MENTLAMVLAGGQGSRLNILAKHRAKPAIPFGGIYRLIDFTLNNIMCSNITNVGILTQYRPSSLIEHIQTGETWGFYGKNRSATILPPYTGEKASSWYKGTADAIYQNKVYLDKFTDVNKILVLSGDHIYNMNYNKLIEYHKKKKAALTIVARHVPLQETKRFGTIIVDKHDKIIAFDEKPDEPKSTLISMGVYLFNKKELMSFLEKDIKNENSHRDFGKDIVRSMLDKSRVYAYRFNDYWRDVGTIQSYWDASMEMLFSNNEIDFKKWHVRTNLSHRVVADRKPGYIANNTQVKNSLISDGCVIKGNVENSILSPGVNIGKGSYIKDSIVFHDAQIKANTVIDRCIVDKSAVIGNSCYLGNGNLPGTANKEFSDNVSSGITIIGKKTKVPKGLSCGRNCIFYPSLSYRDFKQKRYDDGETVRNKSVRNK